jgi:hypothetical protein
VNWSLINIVCGGAPGILIGSDNNFDPGDTGFTVQLFGGENVSCTFTNNADPDVPVGGIVGLSEGGDATVQSSGSSFVVDQTLPAAALAVATVGGALAFGGWYARRRWPR